MTTSRSLQVPPEISARALRRSRRRRNGPRRHRLPPPFPDFGPDLTAFGRVLVAAQTGCWGARQRGARWWSGPAAALTDFFFQHKTNDQATQWRHHPVPDARLRRGTRHAPPGRLGQARRSDPAARDVPTSARFITLAGCLPGRRFRILRCLTQQSVDSVLSGTDPGL